jgi:predicted membrane GTPase involved in stress response
MFFGCLKCRKIYYYPMMMMHDCLFKELKSNVALNMIKSDPSSCYGASGCGQLHLTVLIETMHCEGFGLEVGPPTIIDKGKAELGKIEELCEIAEIHIREEE